MPMMTPRLLGVVACLVNFGILFFNLGFTRAEEIAALNPQVFSEFGQAMILVWGLAFLLAGLSDGKTPSYIWWAFSLEKALYVGSWLLWLQQKSLKQHISSIDALIQWDMASLDIFAPLFHYMYGPIDFIFFVLFAQHGLAAFYVRHKDAVELKRA